MPSLATTNATRCPLSSPAIVVLSCCTARSSTRYPLDAAVNRRISARLRAEEVADLDGGGIAELRAVGAGVGAVDVEIHALVHVGHRLGGRLGGVPVLERELVGQPGVETGVVVGAERVLNRAGSRQKQGAGGVDAAAENAALTRLDGDEHAPVLVPGGHGI